MHIFPNLLKWFFISPRSIEAKLAKYNGYRSKSYLSWSNQLNLSWPTIRKLLKNIKIVDSKEIRNLLRSLIQKNSTIFNNPNCYVTNFGHIGKSGNLILYEFTHLKLIQSSKIIESWKIPSLPSGSTIVFVDDLIGTGKQSFKYISTKLNLILNPSHNPYLLCLFATQDGLDRISKNTNFKVICETVLDHSQQSYIDECVNFSSKEKENLRKLNEPLYSGDSIYYDKGLLIAFYYSVPNNTMPIIWKDNFKYMHKNKTKKWFAVLPREY